jgi:hypothetical protein
VPKLRFRNVFCCSRRVNLRKVSKFLVLKNATTAPHHPHRHRLLIVSYPVVLRSPWARRVFLDAFATSLSNQLESQIPVNSYFSPQTLGTGAI